MDEMGPPGEGTRRRGSHRHNEEIQKQARTGAPAKRLSQLVGFADAASFCHSLKRCRGCTLRELRKLDPHESSRNDNKYPLPQIMGQEKLLLKIKLAAASTRR